MTLAGKVAVVTGGSRGIGFAISRELGRGGARIAMAARGARELEQACARLEAERIVALARPVDVSRYSDVEALVDEVLSRWGQIDVLVNNAGVLGPIGRLDECDLREWKLAVEVNLYGTVHGCRAVLPQMRARRAGKIVNVAGGGVGGPSVSPRWSAYVSSKGAIVQFTESLAREVRDDGIQVNAIAPGPVVTAMTEAVLSAGKDKAGDDLYAKTHAERQRGGESPERAAQLVAWLASEESGALTGKMLSAKWDSVVGLDIDAANRSSLYSLRRIDGVLFDEVRKP